MKSCTLVLLALAGLACGCRSGSETAAMFPESGEVAGWNRIRETRTFAPDTLWQYLDGGADKYTQAGLRRMLTSEYRYQDQVDAVADIYVMSGADGARKILASEPSSDSQPVRFAEEGRLYGASLIFRRNHYLVRLVAYQETPEVGKALAELGRAIDGKLAKRK